MDPDDLLSLISPPMSKEEFQRLTLVPLFRPVPNGDEGWTTTLQARRNESTGPNSSSPEHRSLAITPPQGQR